MLDSVFGNSKFVFGHHNTEIFFVNQQRVTLVSNSESVYQCLQISTDSKSICQFLQLFTGFGNIDLTLVSADLEKGLIALTDLNISTALALDAVVYLIDSQKHTITKNK